MTLITHKAGWVIVEPRTILQNGYVQVESCKIKAYGQGRAPLECGRLIDHGPGALMPPLVNAHAHLELTALKNKITTDNGFIDWIKSVIAQRDFIGTDELVSAAAGGIKELLDTGTLYIGEISSLGITRHLFMESAIQGVWFQEHISNSDVNDCAFRAPFKKISVSGHAPHTTAPSLLVQLKQHTRKHDLPFAIHLAESNEEVEFLATGNGHWANLLNDRGIDIRQWTFCDGSPVQYADRLGILDNKTLAVHLIHSTPKDFDILFQNGVKVCICPRSNKNLHGRLPNLKQMIEAGIEPCLGTDSLASNNSLNMFDEMKYTVEAFPGISPETVLAMATINGSIALDIDQFTGSLHVGKNASFVYAPVDSSSRQTMLEKLIHQDFNEKVKLIQHDTM